MGRYSYGSVETRRCVCTRYDPILTMYLPKTFRYCFVRGYPDILIYYNVVHSSIKLMTGIK